MRYMAVEDKEYTFTLSQGTGKEEASLSLFHSEYM